jgi:hypothetical protein
VWVQPPALGREADGVSLPPPAYLSSPAPPPLLPLLLSRRCVLSQLYHNSEVVHAAFEPVVAVIYASCSSLLDRLDAFLVSTMALRSVHHGPRARGAPVYVMRIIAEMSDQPLRRRGPPSS